MNEVLTVSGVDCYEQGGVVYLKLENVARGLGFTQEKGGVEYVRWDRVKQYLDELGFSPQVGKVSDSGVFIPENIFYRLAMKAKNEVAERFQALVADEIIPSIRKTGTYAVSLSPVELLVRQAQALLEQEKRMAAMEDEVSEIRAHIETHPTGYYTVAGYASLRGVNVDINRANMLGRKAAQRSRQYGYEIGKTSDPRFGTVNTYHEDILKDVFRGEGR